jgi:hypothetical protein
MMAEQMLKIIFALSAAVLGFTSNAHAQDTAAGESWQVVYNGRCP